MSQSCFRQQETTPLRLLSLAVKDAAAGQEAAGKIAQKSCALDNGLLEVAVACVARALISGRMGRKYGEDTHQRKLSDAFNAARMPFWDAVLGGRD